MGDIISEGKRRQLLEFLQRPESYSHAPVEVRVIETHASSVFIASPFVYKVKKPVNLGFLDFSTLERRHYFCAREVELNRRLAAEMYLGVVAIYESATGFSFDAAASRIVEYAVKMAELPGGFFLHELLAQGALGEREIDRIIERLRRFYESEEPAPEIAEWGNPARLKISTEENFVQVEPFVRRTLSPAAFAAIRTYTNHYYEAKEALFQDRMAQRRIRDCHGDLRLDHVHLTPEAVTIFDCIEFNDRLRFIDVANDLAFLAMDFDFGRANRLGALFLRNAARELRDPGILELADFYKCYRAFVRGKVESLQAKSEEHGQRAARYFHLALRYATVGSEPCVLLLMGRAATGKSTVARALGRELEWPVFSSDRIRKTLVGIPLTTRPPPERRSEVYSEETTARTYETLVEEGLAALARHSGVVLDATFSSRSTRRLLRDKCVLAGIRLQAIELDASDPEIAQRLKLREENPAEVSDARLEDLEKLSAAYEPASDFAPDRIKLTTSGAVSETVKSVLLQLAEKQLVTD